jgi:hypothetical protein
MSAEAPAPSVRASASAAEDLAPPPRRRHTSARAGEVVVVPSHVVALGSTPGDDGRDPTLEPYLEDAMVREVAVDALPYPNDPALPPKTNVTRFEAERLCGERAARLCTEVEWEAVCKGPAGDRYATGATWDTACETDASSCASGYGARAMGALREWTASAEGGAPILRGAKAGDAAPGAHGCARRTRGADTRADAVGFRCCKGGDPAQVAPKVLVKPTLRPFAAGDADLARVFAELPELAPLAAPRLEDAAAAARVADAGAPRDVVFTGQPVLFSPEPGAEVVVVAGHAATTAFVVALYPLRGEKFRLASSFLMPKEAAPVALAYRPADKKLFWTTCWGCPGKEGQVVVLGDHRVRVVQGAPPQSK